MSRLETYQAAITFGLASVSLTSPQDIDLATAQAAKDANVTDYALFKNYGQIRGVASGLKRQDDAEAARLAKLADKK